MQRVGLQQHPLELHRLQQLAQGLDFAAGIGGVGGLGDRHTQALGVEAHLGDEPRCARSGLVDGAPQRLAVTVITMQQIRSGSEVVHIGSRDLHRMDQA